MKKLFNTFLVMVTLLLIFSFFACSNSTRYSLVSGNLGQIDISYYYEYNFIEFNEKDNTYKLENKTKTNGIVTKQTGTYVLDSDGKMTITNNEIPTNNFFLCADETIYLLNGTLTVSGTITGYGACSMTFKK